MPRLPRPPHRPAWRRVAAAAAVCAALAGGAEAWALALGRVAVQSQLGEPLRAEIDLPALTDAEAATLQLELAGPERYRSASLEYAPWLREVTLRLARRPDGRAVIEVRSERVVTEPFVDLVVVARWAGGELLRGYTLLFDPPNLRPPAPVAPLAAPAAAPSPSLPPAPAPAPAPAAAERPAAASPTAGSATGASAARTEPRRVTVRPGDTAGQLARQHRPDGVTLEQMLVALLRANPQAFIRGNVNLLKAGAVIDLPDAAGAAAVDPQEARALVAAQTRDFNEYRRRLAAAAVPQRTGDGQRQAQGKVEAAVSDGAPQAAAQDKLTLSKAGAEAEEAQRVAAERQRQEQQQRAAELERNLRELEQLRQQASTTPTAPPAPAPEAARESPAAPAGEPAPAPPAPAPAPAPAPGDTAPAAPAVPAPVPAPPATEGPVQTVLQHPWTLPAAALVVLLLGALAALRLRRRAAVPATEATAPSADAQAAQPEEAAAMPSAVDTDAPLDPVAEADVYLSYGRDAQAEDLLREALQAEPHRLDVRLKLLEVLARRGDAAAFEAEARALQPLCTADSPEWARTCELGRTLDPDNPLYQPRGAAAPVAGAMAAGAMAAGAAASEEAAPADLPTLDLALDTVDATPQAGDSALEVDLTLEPPAAEETQAAAPPADAQAASESDLGLDFDLDLGTAAEGAAPAGSDGAAPTAQDAPAGLPPELADLSLDLPVDETTEAAALPEIPATDAPDAASQATEPAPEAQTAAEPGAERDPLETKLSLAREFEAIGDVDGARILAEEVVAEAQGELRARAQAFLAQLG